MREQGFDEYMNLVLDEAEEVSMKRKTRKPVGAPPPPGKGGVTCHLHIDMGHPCLHQNCGAKVFRNLWVGIIDVAICR